MQREPLHTTRELVPLLGLTRTAIQAYARQHRIGRRGANRAWWFSDADIDLLRTVLQGADGNRIDSHPPVENR